MLEMVRSRTFGILAGYEDQNDHDVLRTDAVFKLLADRLPEDADLASQPTLSRFENAVTPKALLQLEDWFLERFVNSFEQPPREVTLDVDVTAWHGRRRFGSRSRFATYRAGVASQVPARLDSPASGFRLRQDLALRCLRTAGR